MKQVQSQVTEKPAVHVTRDSTKARIGAMTPSFPPAKVPPRASKDSDKGQ
jgi:hypothetical protein